MHCTTNNSGKSINVNCVDSRHKSLEKYTFQVQNWEQLIHKMVVCSKLHLRQWFHFASAINLCIKQILKRRMPSHIDYSFAIQWTYLFHSWFALLLNELNKIYTIFTNNSKNFAVIENTNIYIELFAADLKYLLKNAMLLLMTSTFSACFIEKVTFSTLCYGSAWKFPLRKLDILMEAFVLTEHSHMFCGVVAKYGRHISKNYSSFVMNV